MILSVRQSHMVNEYSVQATYAIVSPNQRHFRDFNWSNPESFDINQKLSHLQLIHGHYFRNSIRASIGNQIVIEIIENCEADQIRLCDGPGILQCHNINCQYKRYSLEYFYATIDIYREQIRKKKKSVVSFNATMVAVSNVIDMVNITSPLTLQVVSHPSAIMHKSFQLITDRAIQISFDIRNFSGLNSDVCLSGGKFNCDFQCNTLLHDC